MIEAKLDPYLNYCPDCDEQIVRAKGPKGELYRIDVHSPEDGNLALSVEDRSLIARPVTRGQAAGMRAAGQVVYTDHGLTCVRADRWHKSKTHGKATRKYATGSRGRRS